MNYGKNATMLHLRKYDSKKTKLLNKTKIIVLKVFLIVVIVAGAAGISSGIGIMNGIISSAPDISKIDVTPTGYSTTVLAANGEETATLVRAGSSRSRLPAHGRRRQGRRQTGYPAAAAYSTRRTPAG